MSIINCLDELFMCDDKLAECHCALINQFGQPTTFVFQELVTLWVSDKCLTFIF